MSAPEPDGPLVSIVDDDEGMRHSLIDLLDSAGYRTLAFASAEDFLLSGSARAADCLVTDIQMPGMDGFDLKRSLDLAGSTLPVIMITARADLYTEEQLRGCGAACFLRKPFKATALLDCIERSLEPRENPQ
jgi:FixJ family two-component response regulator